MPLVYADEPGKKCYFSGGGTFLTGLTAACGYVRNRNNMKMLEASLTVQIECFYSHVDSNPCCEI